MNAIWLRADDEGEVQAEHVGHVVEMLPKLVDWSMIDTANPVTIEIEWVNENRANGTSRVRSRRAPPGAPFSWSRSDLPYPYLTPVACP